MILIFLHTDSITREKESDTLIMVGYGETCIEGTLDYLINLVVLQTA